jgi:antitoxin (DNA-binding transcriptional repressor) of toxin-antitoxin stability system
MTIRDLRQRWPEAEAALQVEREIIITRDAKPVAKLVRVTAPDVKRPRWNQGEHRKWMKKVFGSKVFPASEGEVTAARNDRTLS